MAKIQYGVEPDIFKYATIWYSAGIKPEDLDSVGAEAWTSEGPEEDRGLVVLGVPVGHRAFCTEVVGHGRLWPIRLWPKPTLATHFWPNRLWPSLSDLL